MFDFGDKTLWASMTFLLARLTSAFPFFCLFAMHGYAWSHRCYFALALAHTFSILRLFLFLSKIKAQWNLIRLLKRPLNLLFWSFLAIIYLRRRKWRTHALMVTVRNIFFILNHKRPAFYFQLLKLHLIILLLSSLDLMVASEKVLRIYETCLWCWT